MSKRTKIFHRQTFQSTNNVVELTVKTIPKDVYQPRKAANQPSSSRNCALKEEVMKGTNKENNNNVCKPPPAPAPKKNSRVTVEVSHKARKHHEVLPEGSTWRDALHNYSSIANSQSDESEHESRARKKRIVNGEKPRQGHAWQQKTVQTFDSEESNTPELIVNRRIRSSETSSQDLRPQQMHIQTPEANTRGQERRGNSHSDGSSVRSPLQDRRYGAASHHQSNGMQGPSPSGNPHHLQQSNPVQVRFCNSVIGG